jgi:hypothetical protein
MGRAYAAEMRYAYRNRVEKPVRERATERPRPRWEDNIKMDLREMAGMDLIHLAQDRDQWRALGNTVMNIRIPYRLGKFLSS